MTNESAKELRKTILPYEKSNTKASVWQIVNTLSRFLLLGILPIKAYQFPIYIT